MADWYCGSVEYLAVTQWAASTVVAIGALRRQLATPTAGNERVFRCTTGGTTAASEPTWVLTKGSTTTESGGVVWTEVTGNSTYNWSAPHAGMFAASSWMAAGDNLYVSDDHAHTIASPPTMTFPGTSASPNRIYCVNHAGSVPPVSADLRTTAVETGTASWGIAGSIYMYGVTLATSNYLSLCSGSSAQFYENCGISMNGGAQSLQVGTSGNSAAALATFQNCTIRISSGISVIPQNAIINFIGGSIAGLVSTGLVFGQGSSSSNSASVVTLDGVDLSGYGSGKTLVGTIKAAIIYRFVNCKLGASVSVSAQSQGGPGYGEIQVINSDSSATGYRMEKYNYAGVFTTDTTDVRSGGASDGVTPIAWKVVTTANAQIAFPFECFEIVKWNGGVGSPITASIPVMSNATLTNADIWLDVEYLGSGSAPQASLQSGRVADLLGTTSTTNWPTDSTSVWTTTGVTGPVQQMLSATFTPQMAGWVRIKVKIAKPSLTIRIDPLVQGF